ncbi:hypothetical protein KEHDKFFH_02315 [Marinobacter maroccanus]|uniref:DUF2303 domain-containing protein n=1 Tax=Marinobacter maroccanus TaxID=2055143 RepID=A0A2S5ZG40_9GAMM|nr:DUF2303 family protein [Marinobacter maroccanus]PPI86174.1 hypothetical protein KEHDKFFH_02315 [Marinobacter maroccanus]
MDKQALEHAISMIISGMAAKHVNEQTDGSAVSLPESVKVEDLERFMPTRRRYRGKMTTTQIDEFAEYTNLTAGEVQENGAEPGTTVPCFVNPENMTAKVLFDLGTLEHPGHADFTARLDLPKTAAFEELLGKNGRPMDQKELAEWLEDWAPQLKVTAENGEPLNLPAAVAAVRRITIGAKSESTSEERTFGGRRSAMSEVEAQNKDTLPAFIEFTCEPYHGLDERTFRLRVSLITGETPKLIMRIVRLEHHQEEMAKEFREHLIHALDGNLVQTFVGNFSP